MNKKLEWLFDRREKSKQIFKTTTDEGLDCRIIKNQPEEAVIKQVKEFFEKGSDLVYPAKYVFCNLVYAYYGKYYFDIDVLELLQEPKLLENSPCEYLYKDHPRVYNALMIDILPNMKKYESSIKKTRLYFKQEFLIFDEDLTEILV